MTGTPGLAGEVHANLARRGLGLHEIIKQARLGTTHVMET